MLKDRSSAAIVAVSDMGRAQKFYAETLGLELIDDSMGDVVSFKTGDSWLVVYKSSEAGTNRANAVVWSCGDEIDAIVAQLQAKGVVFEHYPDMGATMINTDIHSSGDLKLVWFKDPDGNILHLNNM